MLKEMQEIREIIRNLEEKHSIKVLRVDHQDNSMLLRSEGFGNLPTENELVDESSYEKYIYHAILIEGTKFDYLEKKKEQNDND